MKILSFTVLSFAAIAAHGARSDEMPAVLRLPAEKAAQSAFPKKEDRVEFLRGYRYGYLRLLIEEDSTIVIHPENSPFAYGVRTALRHAMERSGRGLSTNISLGGFGYKPVEQVGRLSLGFERSLFIPEKQERGWCLRLPKATRRKNPGIIRNGISLKVKGWLSPEGHYGHFGTCRHEVVVYEMTVIK